MKVTVNDPNEPKTEEQETLPPAETPAAEPVVEETPAPVEVDRVRELELENAALRARADTLKEVATQNKAVDNSNASKDAWKGAILADSNSMTDEDFRAKYKTEKYQATAAILEFDMKDSNQKTQQRIASVQAEQRLMTKHKDFLSVKAEVDEMVAMASPEVRQDPDRLEKLMERAYLAAEKKEVKPAAPQTKENVKRIINSFEKPTPKGESKGSESASDDLPEDIRALGKSFGLTSEKERKELLSNAYIPMDLGGGYVFRDPAKGVEKVS